MKKKIVAMVLILAVLPSTLVGCKEKVKCDFCGEIARCETTEVWGEELYICDDCLDELNELMG